MEAVFAFLFKFRPFFFSEGEFGFRSPVEPMWLVAALVIGALVVAVFYLKSLVRLGGKRPWLVWVLRAAFFSFTLLLLLRPTLTLSRLVPRQSVMMVLVDNSQSLGIEEEGVARGEPVRSLVLPDSPWRSALEEKFHLRTLRFASSTDVLKSADQLDWSGSRTDLASALKRVAAEAKSLPVSSVVLLSDGSDNSSGDVNKALEELKARGIVIHTVGVGPERLARDVELASVSSPDRLLPDSVGLARLTIRHSGVAGETARIEVREGNSLIDSRDIRFPMGTDLMTAEVKMLPKSEGVKVYQFRLVGIDNEDIRLNNSRQTVLEVDTSRPKILYVEGRPRWEYKFLRQALDQDEYLHLESLLRTALNKYYRQGIDQETTLAAGFPTTREELFTYRGIVLGDVESAFFSYQQMEMLKDFVSRRGGGLLMMGGSTAMGEGGFQNTPVEEVLPVWLGNEVSPAKSYLKGEARIGLTAFGANHPALQLVGDPEANRSVWEEMPSLADWNLVGRLKPGATLLASLIPTAGDREDAPLLVSHRFGRGLGVAFLTGSSWRWQMLKDHKDVSHETFWRQILRWLISTARDRLSVETDRQVYFQGDQVRIDVEVNDPSFNGVNDSHVVAQITAPSGDSSKINLRWNGREDGAYEGKFSAGQDGLYTVSVEAESSEATDGSTPLRAASHFLASSSQREFFEPVQKVDFLRRIAQDSGGRYYSLADAERLPLEADYIKSETAVTEVLDLWDMPINLAVLIGLLCGEWILRKRWGAI